MAYSCRHCNKTFSKKYNRNRHEEQIHQTRLSEDEDSSSPKDTDSEVKEKEMRSGYNKKDIFGTYNPKDVSESIQDDSDHEDENPWERVITEAWENIRPEYEITCIKYLDSGDDTDSASDKAFQHVKMDLLNEIANIFLDELNWVLQMKRDAIYQKLTKTACVVPDREDFGEEEAMQYALRKRKFLLEQLIERFHLPWDASEEDTTEETDF